MFGWEYPPVHSGGLGVACQGLVRGLLQQNVQVTLILPHSQGVSGENLDIRSSTTTDAALLESIRLASVLQPYDTAESFAVRLQKGSGSIDDLYGANLGEAVELFTAMSVHVTKDVHPDVVHCHDWMTMAAGKRAAKHHNVPLVSHVHATELDRTDFHPNPWIAERERMGLLASDRVIAVSDYTKNLLVNHYGISRDKISVVHNGHEAIQASISPAEVVTNLPEKHPLVLFLGRLTVQKNPFQFLEVAKIVHQYCPNVQFVMAGEGGMMSPLMDRSIELGLSDCMIFAGKVSSKEASKLYAKASCFVMPSLSEPFGLVALEAAHHGTPVIVSKQSGVAEVLDHALKIDAWDTDKMADCIMTVLREEPLAMQLKSEASKTVSGLTWIKQAGRVRSIYEQLT